MASKSTTSLALFLALNLIFFTFANACGDCPKPKPPPKCPPPPKGHPPKPPTPSVPTPSVPTPSVPTPSVPTPSVPTPSVPTPSVPPTPSKGKCPKDTLKLGVCANVLSIIGISIGSPPTKPCCALLKGLADTEAALCLCTALKANVLGINLNIPIALSVILNNCGKKVPSGFECS